ncbi:hypothetical protein CRG98_002683 [Punica granatum]|uniref:Reverse transcriptase Ty1/copia-type domain-containing protein n=1 Tax=Punica granatum TaxID=22663 RepID=A0A2I0L9T9_PUNGR|nr:hypothetical protein CRG98_002683 [Punica granatum]
MGRHIVLDEESSMPQTNQAPISMDTNKPIETPIQIENVTEPRRSSRVTHTPARYLNLHENVQELFVHGDNDHRDDPNTYEEAISNIDSSKWLEDMRSEMDSMSKNQVCDLVDPPEAMLKSIRMMLAIAAHYDYEIWQMNVKTAFLNSYIEEDIFMDQPKGFESKDKSKIWLSNTFSMKDLGEATYIVGIWI